jgi:2-amino-4-hydroxy-6-hydroxymethyldihydropteridine diphosphokinase
MILIALGANLPSPVGDPVVTLRGALETLAERNIQVARLSPFYSAIAWPDPKDPPFVNAVASLLTQLEPAPLLAALHDVEVKFGRTRKEPNFPRTLDLDIIDYEGRIEPGPPELPHPRAATRAFVLVPLRDIAPAWCHPVNGHTVSRLIAALPVATEMPRNLIL